MRRATYDNSTARAVKHLVHIFFSAILCVGPSFPFRYPRTDDMEYKLQNRQPGSNLVANRRSTGPRFGAHVSVAGGLQNAFTTAVEVDCDCLQIFVKNQRQWQASELDNEQIAAFRGAQSETGLGLVVAHASYLLNMASPDRAMRQRSVAAMIDELGRCEALGVESLVFHPGSHMDATVEQGIENIAESLDEVCRQTPDYRTLILLETTAGQGTAIGHRFEHLAAILANVKVPKRLGVCLDTCHLFAAGYDFRTDEGYEDMIAELDSAIGLATVKCVHVNDSKRECGSRVDRHEHIGKGKIGKQGFIHLVNDKRLAGLPMILETPKGKDGRGTDLDKVNLKRLRALLGSS